MGPFRGASEALAHLAGSRLRLERLELGLSGSVDVEGWSSSPALAGLRALHLQLDRVPRDALRALLDAPLVRRIERITVFAWGDGWEEPVVAGPWRSNVAFEPSRDDWSWLAE